MTKKLNELFEIELTTKTYIKLIAAAAAITSAIFILMSIL